jgi:hypothetical protein
MSNEEIQRFAQRSQEERSRAMRTPDPEAAARHIELAERYDAVAKAFAAIDRTRMGQA